MLEWSVLCRCSFVSCSRATLLLPQGPPNGRRASHIHPSTSLAARRPESDVPPHGKHPASLNSRLLHTLPHARCTGGRTRPALSTAAVMRRRRRDPACPARVRGASGPPLSFRFILARSSAASTRADSGTASFSRQKLCSRKAALITSGRFAKGIRSGRHKTPHLHTS